MPPESFPVQPIAFVRNARSAMNDTDWDDIVSEISLEPSIPSEALLGLASFSHVEIIFLMHKVTNEEIVPGKRHPRDNPNWPEVGIFAQRGRVRPNRIGATIVSVVKLDGRTVVVRGLDAIDGTPVLDIKPVYREFLPREDVRQPEWVAEVMKGYW